MPAYNMRAVADEHIDRAVKGLPEAVFDSDHPFTSTPLALQQAQVEATLALVHTMREINETLNAIRRSR